MPTLTRWYIKTALAWLVAALATGALLQTRMLSPAARSYVWPAYLHLITVGWLTGLIFGVAWWLFPRPDRSSPDRARAGWVSYSLLNAGLLLRAVAEPLGAAPSALSRTLLLVSALAQLGGVVTFSAIIWPRVRAR